MSSAASAFGWQRRKENDDIKPLVPEGGPSDTIGAARGGVSNLLDPELALVDLFGRLGEWAGGLCPTPPAIGTLVRDANGRLLGDTVVHGKRWQKQ